MLRIKLRRGPSDVDVLNSKFDFKVFFRTLKNCEANQVTDQNKGDLCANLITLLGKARICTDKYLDASDVAGWILLHSNKKDAL